MNKPLIRWTLGPSSDSGIKCLISSIQKMKSMYHDTFDYVVCHNGVSKEKLDSLPFVSFVDQEKHTSSLPIAPVGPAWKLYPPRLRPESHEIILDNDLIIYKKPPLFTEFLERNQIVATEAFKRSYSGPLEKDIPFGFNLNSGVLCLPPGFDFGDKIKKTIEQNNINWNGHLDEQTLVAHVLNKEKLKIIPLTEISVCLDVFKLGTCGIHFVGLNKGKDQYWKEFHSRKLL